jgi:hypothetical protein
VSPPAARPVVSIAPGSVGAKNPEQSRPSGRAWQLLLLVPFVGTLWVPFYDSLEPRVGGVPFFYWYQFALDRHRRGHHGGRLLRHAKSRAMNVDVVGGGLHRALRARHRARLRRGPLAQGRPRPAPRVGPRRAALRHAGHLVPPRRRPLHGVHVHRGPRARLRRRARSASSRCRTRSSRTPSSSSSCRACGPSRTSTATSRRRLRARALRQQPLLALAIALTGILATMPYIALQLVGIQVVLGAMGIRGKGGWRICRSSSRS